MNANISDEKKKVLIELYNNGTSLLNMEKEVGYCRKKIALVVKRLISEGELKERDRHKTQGVKKVDARAKAKAEEIVALYNDRIKQSEIAKRVGMSEGYVNKLLCQLKRDGVIAPRKRVTTPRKKVTHYSPIYQIAEPTLKPGETIKCTFAVSRTCVYGVQDHNNELNGLCRYASVTNKLRSIGADGCKHCECTKYSKISATNPRLLTKGEIV